MKKFRVLLLTAVLAVAMMAGSMSVFAADTAATPTTGGPIRVMPANGVPITKTVKVSVGNNYYQKIHFIKQTISNKSQDSEAGDAILLESNGHFAMIDTGYKEKVDNEFVYNYLQKKKIRMKNSKKQTKKLPNYQ